MPASRYVLQEHMRPGNFRDAGSTKQTVPALQELKPRGGPAQVVALFFLFRSSPSAA